MIMRVWNHSAPTIQTIPKAFSYNFFSSESMLSKILTYHTHTLPRAVSIYVVGRACFDGVSRAAPHHLVHPLLFCADLFFFYISWVVVHDPRDNPVTKHRGHHSGFCGCNALFFQPAGTRPNVQLAVNFQIKPKSGN